MGIIGRTASKLFFGRLFLRTIGVPYVTNGGLVGLLMGNIGAMAFAQIQGLSLLLAPVTFMATALAQEMFTLPGQTLASRKQSEPIFIIKNGKAQANVIRFEAQVAYLNEIEKALKQRGINGLVTVEYALLEPCGKISVVLNTAPKYLPPANPEHKSISTIIIDNGQVLSGNLVKYGLSELWLENQLKQRGVEDKSQIALGLLTTDGSLYIELKSEPV